MPMGKYCPHREPLPLRLSRMLAADSSLKADDYWVKGLGWDLEGIGEDFEYHFSKKRKATARTHPGMHGQTTKQQDTLQATPIKQMRRADGARSSCGWRRRGIHVAGAHKAGPSAGAKQGPGLLADSCQVSEHVADMSKKSVAHEMQTPQPTQGSEPTEPELSAMKTLRMYPSEILGQATQEKEQTSACAQPHLPETLLPEASEEIGPKMEVGGNFQSKDCLATMSPVQRQEAQTACHDVSLRGALSEKVLALTRRRAEAHARVQKLEFGAASSTGSFSHPKDDLTSVHPGLQQQAQAGSQNILPAEVMPATDSAWRSNSATSEKMEDEWASFQEVVSDVPSSAAVPSQVTQEIVLDVPMSTAGAAPPSSGEEAAEATSWLERALTALPMPIMIPTPPPSPSRCEPNAQNSNTHSFNGLSPAEVSPRADAAENMHADSAEFDLEMHKRASMSSHDSPLPSISEELTQHEQDAADIRRSDCMPSSPWQKKDVAHGAAQDLASLSRLRERVALLRQQLHASWGNDDQATRSNSGHEFGRHLNTRRRPLF